MSERNPPRPRAPRGPEVSIGHIGLSIPGTGRGAGTRVAEGVTQGLAARLPPGLVGRIGRLEVTVRPGSTSDEAVSEAVVDAVLRALPRSRG